jgi:hypothetical protein
LTLQRMSERQGDTMRINNRRFVGFTIAGGLSLALLLTAGTALAEVCTQTDGQVGFYNGTTADDAGCITEAEYAETFSVPGLIDSGVLTDVIDNGDGTVTGIILGAPVTLIGNPLERPLAATPRLEPDAPTVGDYWNQLHDLTGGGIQE